LLKLHVHLELLFTISKITPKMKESTCDKKKAFCCNGQKPMQHDSSG